MFLKENTSIEKHLFISSMLCFEHGKKKPLSGGARGGMKYEKDESLFFTPLTRFRFVQTNAEYKVAFASRYVNLEKFLCNDWSRGVKSLKNRENP